MEAWVGGEIAALGILPALAVVPEEGERGLDLTDVGASACGGVLLNSIVAKEFQGGSSCRRYLYFLLVGGCEGDSNPGSPGVGCCGAACRGKPRGQGPGPAGRWGGRRAGGQCGEAGLGPELTQSF